MLSTEKKIALVCFECMPVREVRNKLRTALTESGKELKAVSKEQMQDFACNALEVKDKKGRSLLLMSNRAFC